MTQPEDQAFDDQQAADQTAVQPSGTGPGPTAPEPTDQASDHAAAPPADQADRLPDPQAGAAESGRSAPVDRGVFRHDPFSTPEPVDTERTQVLGGAAAAGAAGATGSAEQPRRLDDHEAEARAAEAERVRAQQEAQERAEQEAAARARAEERAARERALGNVARSEPQAAEPVPDAIPVRTTDRWAGSLGLFLLRLVLAAIMGVHGFQTITDIAGTTDFLTQVGLPYPGYVAWGLGVAGLLAAVALVFGLATRVAAVGIAAVAIGALALVKWGNFNPFGESGFSGELELLIAAAAILLVLVGPGGWSIDANWRRNRLRAKAGY